MTGGMTKQSDDIYGDNRDELEKTRSHQGPSKITKSQKSKKEKIT